MVQQVEDSRGKKLPLCKRYEVFLYTKTFAVSKFYDLWNIRYLISLNFVLNQSANKRSRAMAARNELYRKTMDLLDNDLDGNGDPNLEDIVQRYFQKRNSRVRK